ncbi:hypothetical protein QCA50_016954 [Cerrena zonata]|uniref:Uncharacterized protein n=1 Tax=Cerrena zonata TaxID=2478898 RepID=A0AAW0FG76_9APHY
MQSATSKKPTAPTSPTSQPPIHLIADVTQYSINSVTKPHRIRLVNLIVSDYTPPIPITLGSKIYLKIIEDRVSPTDNAFPRDYYAFDGWVLGTARAGKSDCDFIVVGKWRGAIEIAILTAQTSFITPSDLPSLQRVGSPQSKWVSEECQRTFLEHLSSDNTRLRNIETAIRGHRSRACMYGPDWSNLFGFP